MKSKPTHKYLLKHIAIPNEHGAWVFLLSPLLIGLFAGGKWSPAIGFLIIAAMAVFLLRQPVTIAIKAYSGRRPRRDLPAARLWMLFYGSASLLAFVGLLKQGFGYLLLLAVPGLLVFAWHLYLVSKRSERRQIGVEIVGSGVLALAAPAALWVGKGFPDPSGWWLFGLVWFQSAASIVYAYLRLAQRELTSIPPMRNRLQMAQRAFYYTTFNLIGVSILAKLGILPHLLFIPFALQWIETSWGALQPAVGVKPTIIGFRQLIVSSLFTLLFIITWQIP